MAKVSTCPHDARTRRIEHGRYWVSGNTRLSYEGQFTTYSSLCYVTPCRLDSTYWPWDVQTCEVYVVADVKADNGSSIIALGSIGQDLKVEGHVLVGAQSCFASAGG